MCVFIFMFHQLTNTNSLMLAEGMRSVCRFPFPNENVLVITGLPIEMVIFSFSNV